MKNVPLPALTSPNARFMIVGNPGSGKTTLLRHLAWTSLRDEAVLPVYLELKGITEKGAADSGGRFAELLFDHSLGRYLHLSEEEKRSLKESFLGMLARGEVLILLDGLDEISNTTFFHQLSRSIDGFVRSDYGRCRMLISTRPYALTFGFDGFTVAELEQLSLRQTGTYLKRYADNADEAAALQAELERNPGLQQLARVPLLLTMFVALRRRGVDFRQERLDLYRLVITNLLVQLDRAKGVSRFRVLDPEGRLKFEVCKALAYDSLLGAHDKEDRFLIRGDDIFKAARQSGSGERPDLLAADVMATPLIREVDHDTYAFAHLTLHEVLAAAALSERDDSERVLATGFFDTAIVELEVLPMCIGMLPDADRAFAMLERLPDSLSLAGVRLRFRALAYARRVGEKHVRELAEWLSAFLQSQEYRDEVISKKIEQSVIVGQGRCSFTIEDALFGLLHGNRTITWREGRDVLHMDVSDVAAGLLGAMGSERAVDHLLRVLSVQKKARSAAKALGEIGNRRATDGLVDVARHGYMWEAFAAISALAKFGDRLAIEAMTLMDGADPDLYPENDVIGSFRRKLEERDGTSQ